MKRIIISRIVVSLFFVAMSANNAFAQWEHVDLDGLEWKTNPRLNVSSSTLDNLIISNSHALSKEDSRKKDMQLESVEMSFNWLESQPWRISFDIWNANCFPKKRFGVYDEKGKKTWHISPVNWGYGITVKNSLGEESFEKYYSNGQTRNAYGQHTDTYDSDKKRWITIA